MTVNCHRTKTDDKVEIGGFRNVNGYVPILYVSVVVRNSQGITGGKSRKVSVADSAVAITRGTIRVSFVG